MRCTTNGCVCVCGAFTFISLSNKWFFCCAQADRILKGGKNAYDKTKQLYSWYVYFVYIMYIMCLCRCSQFLLPRHQPTIFTLLLCIYALFFFFGFMPESAEEKLHQKECFHLYIGLAMQLRCVKLLSPGLEQNSIALVCVYVGSGI